MLKLLITIGDKSYRCEYPETEEERKIGLSKRESILPDEGMLFDFSGYADTPIMQMRDTKLELDMIGIDEDGIVLKVITPEPLSQKEIPFFDCSFVLEVKANSGIVVGDEFKITDTNLNDYIMKIIAPDGTAQGLLKGGERIFSRISTKKMISMAKKAYLHRNNQEQYNKDCKKLGEFVLKELHAQNNREPQYVEPK